MPFKTVIRSYNGKNTNGSPLKNVLRASVGNQVKIVEGNRNGWTKVELRGQRGLFPTYYLGEDLIQWAIGVRCIHQSSGEIDHRRAGIGIRASFNGKP